LIHFLGRNQHCHRTAFSAQFVGYRQSWKEMTARAATSNGHVCHDFTLTHRSIFELQHRASQAACAAATSVARAGSDSFVLLCRAMLSNTPILTSIIMRFDPP